MIETVLTEESLYHSNFIFLCNTESGFKESLSIALGFMCFPGFENFASELASKLTGLLIVVPYKKGALSRREIFSGYCHQFPVALATNFVHQGFLQSENVIHCHRKLMTISGKNFAT